MLPRRSLRLQKMRDRSFSTAIATSSNDTASKSTMKAAKKRGRTVTDAEMDSNDDIATNLPKQKRIKFDFFVKIDNLEYFPRELLMIIFGKLDDAGLLHLSEVSNRFAAIVQTVFTKRYANRYFVVNDERLGGDPELYRAQLDRFGSAITAIQINFVDDIDEMHWTTKLLRQHIDRIEKLTFDSCSFRSNEIFPDPLNAIMDLTIQNSFARVYKCYQRNQRKHAINLPDCRSLQKLEIRSLRYISYDSLESYIRNNPMLESVKLYNCSEQTEEPRGIHASINDSLSIEYPFHWHVHHVTTLIADHLVNIKELALVESYPPRSNYLEPDAMKRIVSSFKHLESLALSRHSNMDEIFQQLSVEYNHIKHFECHTPEFDKTYDLINLFPQIESLFVPEWDGIDSLDLRELRHLSFGLGYEYETETVLINSVELFCKHSSLRTITVHMMEDNVRRFINIQFFGKFIETIAMTGKSDARIEVQVNGEIIGFVTKDGLFWRNKLMHWIECEQNYSSKKTNILDLAKHSWAQSNARQTNLLDLVFDYLDVNSLSSFSETSPRSKHLVIDYVRKHSQQHGAFNITDEFRYFNPKSLKNFFSSKEFFDCAKNLNIHKFFRESCIVVDKFKIINKLSIYTEYPTQSYPHRLPRRQLQKLTVDGSNFSGYFELHEIYESYPKVEIIEFKNANLFNDFNQWADCQSTVKFRNLKKFIFNYRGETQVKNLKKIFKYKKTKLVPIFT